MSFKLWVRYGDGRPVQVSFGGGNVDELIDAVKARLKPILDDVAVSNISLREHDEEEDLEPDLTLTASFQTTAKTPLEVHVAESSRGTKRNFEDALMERVTTTIEKALRQERRTVAISKVSRDEFELLLQTLGLKLESIDYDVDLATKRSRPFRWIADRTEVNQKKEYLKWLRDNIDLPKNVEFFDTSAARNTLDSTQGILPFNIRGTVDVAVVDTKNVKTRNIAGGIRLGIETKKEVTAAHVRQAVLELVTANIYSQYPVAIVLTDLGETWQFFWLENVKVITCEFPLNQAKTLIEAIVWDAPQIAAGDVESEPEPHNKRCNMLQVMTDGAVLGRTNGKPARLEQVLKRPKVDLMQLLPEDDIAQMQDVFDVMSPEEVLDWKQRRLLGYFEMTPALQSCPST